MRLPAIVSRLLQSVKPAQTTGWWFRGNTAKVFVSHDAALTYSALWACVLAVSDPISMMPFRIHRQTGTDGKYEPDERLLVTKLLDRRPNPEMTAMQFRQALTAHALTWGNGYAEIERNGAGQAVALWPLPPSWVRPWRLDDGTLVYLVQPEGSREPETIFRSEDVLHIRGLGWDGITGYDVIRFHAQATGNYLAGEQYVGSFFGNGAHMSALISTEEKVTPEAAQRIREQFEDLYSGARNAFRIGFLNGKIKLDQMSVHPEAAQLIEARKFNVTDCARIFKVPSHVINDLERATFSNIEHLGIQFVVYALMPWATRWEQEVDAKLLGRDMQATAYSNIDLKFLMRGDVERRKALYESGRSWGWLTANDIRQEEDMPPLPSDVGDLVILPSNYVPADRLGEMLDNQAGANRDNRDNRDGPDDVPNDSDARAGVQQSVRAVLKLSIGRVLSREQHRMDEAWDRHRGTRAWSKKVDAVIQAQRQYATETWSESLECLAPLIGVAHEGRAAAVSALVEWYAEAHRALWMDATERPVVDGEEQRERLLERCNQIMIGEALA